MTSENIVFEQRDLFRRRRLERGDTFADNFGSYGRILYSKRCRRNDY